MMRRLLALLALTFVLSARADDAVNLLNTGNLGMNYSQSILVSSVPGTTSGAYIEDTPSTVFHWIADTWNMIRFPEQVGTAAGGAWSVASNTVTLNAAIAPDGSNHATSIVATSTTNSSISANVNSGAAGVPTTFSIWLRGAVGGELVRMASAGGAAGGVVLTTSWQRYSLVSPTAASGAWFLQQGTIQTGQAGTLYFAWGAQSVHSPVPLPYVPNFGATVGGAGDTFVMQGTVPLSVTSPLFPAGTTAGQRAVGSLDDTHYFTGAAPATPATAITICVAFNSGASTAGTILQDDGANRGTLSLVAGAVRFTTTGTVTTANTVIANSVNIACAGESGTSASVKLNGGVTVTAARPLGAAAGTLRIGRASGAGSPLNGSVLDIWISATAWDEANVAAIEARAMSYGGTGPFFLNDANTVFRALGAAYDGATWGTPFGNLTSVGPALFSDLWTPSSGSGLPMLDRLGYGSFADANYFSLGAGSDVCDFAADFSACFVFATPTNLTAAPILFVDGVSPTSGYVIGLTAPAGTLSVFSFSGGIGVTTANATPPGAINVACGGRAGGNIVGKMNLGAFATAAAGFTQDTTHIAKLGRYESAGRPYGAGIFEAWFSSDTPTDALFTKIQRRVLQQFGANGEILTTTRDTAIGYPVQGPAQPTLFYSPANVVVQSPEGIFASDATTNLALQSESLNTAPWVATGTVVTADQAVFVDGLTSMEKLDSTGQLVTSFVAQPVTVTSSTGPFTVSAWVAATSGTAVESVGMTVGTGTATACTCIAFPSDGSVPPTCTAATSTVNGFAFATVGTVPVRLSVTCSSTLAAVAVSPFVESGQWNTSVSTGFFGGVQFEAHPHPTSYMPTAAATVARTRDVIKYDQNPFGSYQGPFCIDATSRPAWGRAWTSDDARLIHIGTTGSANQVILQANAAGNVTFSVVDGAVAFKTVTFATGYTGDSVHRLTGCSDQAGNLTLYSDGVAGGAVAGAGTGIMSMTSGLAVQLLGTNSAPTAEADASIRNVRFCRGTPAQCLAVP
jgi:hypothetical protein